MANWSRISSLLAREIILWEKIKKENRNQMEQFEYNNNSLESFEQYLEKKDSLLESLLAIQHELDSLKLSIEQDKDQVEEALQQEMMRKTGQLVDLQAEIVEQEKAMKLYFQKAGDEIREQIKNFRSRRARNNLYNPTPIMAESMLLDEKQ